ncbi:MAG: ABC transporter ATP-binding protein [Acidimicrobiales bacterium]
MTATSDLDLTMGVATERSAVRLRGLEIAAISGDIILEGIDLRLPQHGVVGIIGESGSGKSTLVRAILGAVAPGLVVRGEVAVDQDGVVVDMFTASPSTVRSVRSNTLAFLGQNPAAALTPTQRLGDAIAERLRTTGALPAVSDSREDRVGRLLEAVQLPSDNSFRRRYPHEVSGGQAQRVALARALASEPKVLLLDEPTTGLDVLTQSLVLDELERQQHATPRCVLIVSHDLAVIARLADSVVVLRHGRIVDAGSRRVLQDPRNEYTATLVASCPDPHRIAAPTDIGVTDDPALEIVSLHASHGGPTHRIHGTEQRVVTAAGVDLTIHRGECVALVGASGEGKSTLARAIVGAHIPDQGVVRLGGRDLSPDIDRRDAADRFAIQLVPQDPGASLNPRRRVGLILRDAIRRRDRQVDADAEAASLLRQVGLDPSITGRRPPSLSGGERQRVAIARALTLRPTVLICDEVTSALDVSVQAGILDLLRSLAHDGSVAILLITHDLGVVARTADRVAVLHGGRICEQGPVDRVLGAPEHPATRRLLAASPSLAEELTRARVSPETPAATRCVAEVPSRTTTQSES